MYTVIFMRHGESQWNLENRFTGWTDVDLTPKGVAEARRAGELIREAGLSVDLAFTSVLKRAIRTLFNTLDVMDALYVPVVKDYRLNERHYGALQGLNKAETAQKFGEEQVHVWRRSYDVPPPALEESDARFPGNDPRYAALAREVLPLTECLKDTVKRAVPYWKETIVPEIRSGKRVLVAAHGNSLRALIKEIDAMSDEEIVSLNIPTGRPLVYEFDEDMRPLKHYYLGDADEIRAAQEAVKNQGKAR